MTKPCRTRDKTHSMNPIHSMNPSMTPVLDQTLKCTQDMARRNKKVAAWMIERQKAPRTASARQAGVGTGLRRHAWIHRIDHGQISTRDLFSGAEIHHIEHQPFLLQASISPPLAWCE